MVNKERVTLWVDALRDPKLVQGQGYLARRPRGAPKNTPWEQCCLDVACRVAMDNGVELQEATSIHLDIVKRGYKRAPGDWDFAQMPEAVYQWFGFDSSNVHFRIDGQTVSAIQANDELKLSFPQIADLIVANFLSEPGEQEQTNG